MNESNRQRGAIAMEYALLAFFVAVALVGALTVLGGEIRDLYSHLASMLP